MRKMIVVMLVLSLLLTGINTASANSGTKTVNDRTPYTESYSVVPFENEPIQSVNTIIEPIDPVQLSNVDGAIIVDKLPQVVDAVYGEEPTVTDSVYGRSARMMTAMSDPIPSPSILSAINNLNLKNMQSPFRINKGAESISPVSGSLSLQEADLSLPGRNGLSFTLSRYYDSSSSNVYDKEVSFGLFCSCIIEYDAISYTERYNDNT
ncbi:hypothetical protein K0T92_13725, partial [Paenibacillus oenotherae]